MFRLKRWSGKGLFERPAALQSHSQRMVLDANLSSPRPEAKGFAIERNQSCFACILALREGICPAAVVRFVVSFVVDAVDRCLWERPGAHVFQEVEKRLSPADAYSNSSPTVVFVIAAIRVVASLLHSVPHAVYGATRVPTSASASASTRGGGAPAEIASGDGRSVAALAFAEPVDLRLDKSKRNNCKATVGVTRFIFGQRRQFRRIALRHDSSPKQVNCVRAGRVVTNPFGSMYFNRHRRPSLGDACSWITP